MDRRYQVFISSTFRDLEDERKEVMEAIINLNCFPAGMEMFPASDTEQFDYIKRIIDESDYYVIIVAGKYGSVAEDGISYTEKEFDYAKEKGVPILAFVKKDIETIPGNKIEADPDKKKKLESFRERVLTGRVAKFWGTPDELKYKIYNSLSNEFKIHPRAGWIRGNQENNEELLKQLNDLRLENSKLKNTPIKENDQEGLLSEILEYLNKNFSIEYSDVKAEDDYKDIEINCYDIIKNIGPKMLTDLDRDDFEEFLILKIVRPISGSSVTQISEWEICDDSIDDIYLKLTSLKLIEEGDPDTFNLTMLGKKILYSTVKF